jgi:hypothetical protein
MFNHLRQSNGTAAMILEELLLLFTSPPLEEIELITPGLKELFLWGEKSEGYLWDRVDIQ